MKFVRALVCGILTITISITFSIFSPDADAASAPEFGNGVITLDGVDRESEWLSTEVVSYFNVTSNIRYFQFSMLKSGRKLFAVGSVDLKDKNTDAFSVIKLEFLYKENFCSAMLSPKKNEIQILTEDGMTVTGKCKDLNGKWVAELQIECEQNRFENSEIVYTDISFADAVTDTGEEPTVFYFEKTPTVEFLIGGEKKGPGVAATTSAEAPEEQPSQTLQVKPKTVSKSVTVKDISIDEVSSESLSEVYFAAFSFNAEYSSSHSFFETLSSSETSVTVSVMCVFGILALLVVSLSLNLRNRNGK